ncbi:hypothetical protein DYE49_10030 [Treponema rectale]|uniref:Uncharacterized protein n=1 Tax=Treponema rectale TaxID=744512 RepID=A0A840SGR0_9SPIR|nr:hypothetical protein [Treponema rectale]MBB5219348.1 hypothetical protein [Treponema rectale]QOS40767.1 hypothetical protein DYE49_10030 [Treponema rectale]
MENILLNIWIEMKSGIKVRLISKDVYNSDENYIVIMEINENGISRNINLMVKGRKVFDASGKCLDFGDAYPSTTEYGKRMITKQFINAWLE